MHVKAYEQSFKMDGVTDPLRFVKFSKKTPEGKYSQVLVATTDFDIPLQTLYKIMHKRWDIENSTFNKLKTYAGLGHCFIHHTNAIEAILHLMITANNIMQLFVHRRLTGKTVKEMPEKELIRLIQKDMYTYKEKLVFDTC
ncbi:MAG TPA: transposase [Epulopiscium sp.]|nr:transposase [Candidatus Epulonipiscium sp.]